MRRREPVGSGMRRKKPVGSWGGGGRVLKRDMDGRVKVQVRKEGWREVG